MKLLAAFLCLGLLALSVIACGSETAEPPNTPVPATPTQPAASPTVVPVVAPTATTAPTQAPTPEPLPTDTPVPEPEPTAAPEPTATQEPTETPEPTVTPEPTPTLAPAHTATPEPTAVPEPPATSEPTPEPELPIATDLAPLGDNLLWVAYFDNRTKQWSVYDHSGTFSPDKLPLPPGENVPDASAVGSLTELLVKSIYWISLSESQTVQLGDQTQTFSAGENFIVWK